MTNFEEGVQRDFFVENFGLIGGFFYLVDICLFFRFDLKVIFDFNILLWSSDDSSEPQEEFLS